MHTPQPHTHTRARVHLESTTHRHGPWYALLLDSIHVVVTVGGGTHGAVDVIAASIRRVLAPAAVAIRLLGVL